MAGLLVGVLDDKSLGTTGGGTGGPGARAAGCCAASTVRLAKDSTVFRPVLEADCPIMTMTNESCFCLFWSS